MASQAKQPPASSEPPSLSRLLLGLGRAAGGAIIFSLPMFMTMEMWWLGFYMDRILLALLLAVNMPLLVVLSRHSGFERTASWFQDLRDAAIAYGIGIVTSAGVLTAFGLLGPAMTVDEIVGKIAIQSVPASIGALLGRSQLGGGQSEPSQRSEGNSYASELFLMGVGALFLSLNVAPTEEMVLIAYKMTVWHALVLVVLSLALMHAFVYAVEFKGADISLSPDTPWWSSFLRFTMAGYGVAICVSLYILWTFGRTEGSSVGEILMSVVVLGFPAAIGAAAARLIL